MRREIVEVADGFIFRGVAQLTSPVHGGRSPSAHVYQTRLLDNLPLGA